MKKCGKIRGWRRRGIDSVRFSGNPSRAGRKMRQTPEAAGNGLFSRAVRETIAASFPLVFPAHCCCRVPETSSRLRRG
ncbi:MAG: hypothetical protein D6741_11850 [Planctomycetota bacterium]|nr:MAG: hypothetical protein D6741_11850 [Planctomycetota bacterium]